MNLFVFAYRSSDKSLETAVSPSITVSPLLIAVTLSAKETIDRFW